jgi:hypothetical protein
MLNECPGGNPRRSPRLKWNCSSSRNQVAVFLLDTPGSISLGIPGWTSIPTHNPFHVAGLDGSPRWATFFLHRHGLSTTLDQGQDQNDRHEHHRPRTIAKVIVLTKHDDDKDDRNEKERDAPQNCQQIFQCPHDCCFEASTFVL